MTLILPLVKQIKENTKVRSKQLLSLMVLSSRKLRHTIIEQLIHKVDTEMDLYKETYKDQVLVDKLREILYKSRESLGNQWIDKVIFFAY